MTRIYNLINEETMEIIAYTKIGNCDVSDEEILDCRLETAIDNKTIPDANYIWDKSSYCFGILV